MKKHISIIDIVQQGGIPHPGNVLASRPFGRQAREIINRLIVTGQMPNILELDFIEVAACDYSFVDEVIIETKIYLKDHSEILMVVLNMNDTVFGNLQAALAMREKQGMKIQVLCRTSGEYQYVGSLEENLAATFKVISQRGSITAREIADIFDIQINNASNRLKKLYDAKLVLRVEQIDATGKQHVYSLPK